MLGQRQWPTKSRQGQQNLRAYSSAVPAGTFGFPNHIPSTQVLVYFQPSLRDYIYSQRSGS